MPDQNNRRISTRRDQQEVLSLTIISTSRNPELLGKKLNGSTVDISATGLRIKLSSALPADSTINMSIELKDDPSEFFLSGKVRWCRVIEAEDTYQAGVVLHAIMNTETDYKRWREIVK
ncbi:MAG: PilZ domain-containing protein [Gammaproteobacteria bacterium]|nr:PilZ domain-containing protein [Gammaproteobacteria bacterium]